MWRIALQTALLFLTPFVAYVGFHLLQRRWPFVAELWHGRVLSLLTIAGLITAIAGMLTLGLTGRQQGAYVPAHVENGRLVPGQFQ
ncbi:MULTISPECIES: DUF6111 family protein [Methylocystis]|uniref:Uncharacterized protein n=1 Tax=Methylocystis iwaonis TaxID=2885079 RepID=A0ABM8E991_9HYPH|nr:MULTISPECIES: DUF6111 family protein [Methylocystis]MBL1256403.1 hypothetical protein [Methylocystis sp. Sn-Cys]MDJ0447891.1 DUF6111 family protein [Methylocystis sp. JR02]BDV34547.1 hypothetical protein SS37A_20760 [Methylocystis iwaonis]